MTKPVSLTQTEWDDIVLQLTSWLGVEGVLHFKTIKENQGRIDAQWMELGITPDFVTQYIPRSTIAQEKPNVIEFLKTLELCNDWDDEDFDNKWVPLLDDVVDL